MKLIKITIIPTTIGQNDSEQRKLDKSEASSHDTLCLSFFWVM